jgi:hypothetical protein
MAVSESGRQLRCSRASFVRVEHEAAIQETCVATGDPTSRRKLVKKSVALAVSLLLLLAASAHAQDQQSFKTIVGKGYEIKSVTFARGESTENREIFVVTLQKEKSVAVCYFAAVNWINLSAGTLEDSKRCDVRW